MENNLSQSIQQQQKQLLSQRQQQSLELLHLPLQELDARINEELEKNPLLDPEYFLFLSNTKNTIIREEILFLSFRCLHLF